MGTTAKIELLIIMVLLAVLARYLEQEIKPRSAEEKSPEMERLLILADLEKPPRLPNIPQQRQQRRALRTHTVRSGDTLERIARRQLGDARRWREIHTMNRNLLRRPEDLRPGMELRLPPRVNDRPQRPSHH